LPGATYLKDEFRKSPEAFYARLTELYKLPPAYITTIKPASLILRDGTPDFSALSTLVGASSIEAIHHNFITDLSILFPPHYPETSFPPEVLEQLTTHQLASLLRRVDKASLKLRHIRHPISLIPPAALPRLFNGTFYTPRLAILAKEPSPDAIAYYKEILLDHRASVRLAQFGKP
jgi:hypothetical protein